MLAAAGCGGGQIAGQDASTTPATQATPSPSPTTATAPSATVTKRPARRRSSPTANRSPTAAQPPGTTQPPAGTTPATTTRSATATHTPKPAAAAGTPIDETAQLTLVSKQSATEYTQRGTVTGTYGGEMTLTAKITNDGISVHFSVTTPDGTVTGHGLAIVHITGATLEPITGTAAITGGTRRFASAHGRGLKVRGRAALDASRGVVHLTGTVFL